MMRSSGPIVSPLTSGTTSGQSGSMRFHSVVRFGTQLHHAHFAALLLSMTVIPALANSGAHFLDTSPPALNSATCGRAARHLFDGLHGPFPALKLQIPAAFLPRFAHFPREATHPRATPALPSLRAWSARRVPSLQLSPISIHPWLLIQPANSHITSTNSMKRRLRFYRGSLKTLNSFKVPLWFSRSNLSVNSNDHFMSLPDDFKKVEREC